MQNPNSAIQRIKNHLAYKLGQAMIEYNNNGGGYIRLCKKLYQIKKQYKKEKRIYQETIKVFPQLKYPPLEKCTDYEQALKYQFHLSYFLGEVLLQTFRTWYKGSMFKLSKNIQEANADFKTFKKIFEKFKEYNINIPKDLLNNKRLFLKKVLTIENILNTHKDYKAILDNIFHNFTFFLKHFNLIEEWLLSNDFNEKYKKQNHPYPSLLDPKKLNDKNETINYHNIAAELAWEMNLPLPENYEFVFLAGGLSGHGAMMSFFNKCKINYLYHHHNPMKERYVNYYIFLQNKAFNIISYSQYTLSYCLSDFVKFFKLITKKVPIIFLVRDPIARLKTGANHCISSPKSIKDINLNTDYNDIFKNKMYVGGIGKNFCYTESPSMDYLPRWINNDTLFQTSCIDFFVFKELIYIDMQDIKPTKAFDTICTLANKFGFEKPTDRHFFQGIMNGDLSGFVPLNLYVNMKNVIQDIDTTYKDESSIHILISSSNLIEFYKQSKEYLNFTQDFFDQPLKYENLGIFIKPQDFKTLKQNDKLFYATKKYLNNFIKALEQRIELEKSKLFKEEDILNYLKENKELRLKLKNILDKELIHIKQHRPDIVASWKYYQEFEKMCEELAKNSLE